MFLNRYGFVLSLSLSIVLCAAIGCGSEKEEESPYAGYSQLIQGQWQLHTAYRNDAQTHVLNGTYFHFPNPEVMETNLPFPGQDPGSLTQASYHITADSLIVHIGNEKDQLFLIGKLDSHYLGLTTVILNQAFRFDLERQR